MVGRKNPNWGGIKQSVAYSKVAASIVKEFGLAPMAKAAALPGAKAAGARAAAKTLIPGGRTPGIPAAHLHYKGEIYLLNTKQWKAFSTGLMAEFQAKIGKAKTISFEQLQIMSDAVEKLAK